MLLDRPQRLVETELRLPGECTELNKRLGGSLLVVRKLCIIRLGAIFQSKRVAKAVQARGLKFQGISASMSLLGQRVDTPLILLEPLPHSPASSAI